MFRDLKPEGGPLQRRPSPAGVLFGSLRSLDGFECIPAQDINVSPGADHLEDYSCTEYKNTLRSMSTIVANSQHYYHIYHNLRRVLSILVPQSVHIYSIRGTWGTFLQYGRFTSRQFLLFIFTTGCCIVTDGRHLDGVVPFGHTVQSTPQQYSGSNRPAKPPHAPLRPPPNPPQNPKNVRCL